MKKLWSVQNFVRAVTLGFLLGPIFSAFGVSDSFVASGSWVAPAGVTSVDVEAWGGGGAGGGQNQNSDGGGGGGGGAYSKKLAIPVVPGNSYTVSVGAGGVGVSGGTGGAGGDSYFINAATVMAKGGAGGAPSTGTPPAGGSGGVAASGVGTTKFPGGSGGRGRDNSTGRGGPGGSSAGTLAAGTDGPDPWTTLSAAAAPLNGGIGGDGGAAGANGSSPVSGNGGGGGGSGDGTSKVGGNGSVGKVVVTYLLPPAVSSIDRVSVNPNAPNSAVSWLVTFSQSVTGVDTADFLLVQTAGATGATLTSVVGSGTSWTVTANSGTAYGSLGLNLVDNDTVVSAVPTPLGGTGLGNGNFTGQVYSLVAPVPLLTKVASASAAAVGDLVTFTITASNPFGVAMPAVSISDTLPVGMAYAAHVVTLGTVNVAGSTVSWTIPSLIAGGSAQLTLVVSLSQQGSLTNTVTSPGAVSASASVLVLASAITHFRLDEPVGSWTGAVGEVIDSGGTALHGRRVTSISPTTTNTLAPSPTIASQYPSVVGGFCNAGQFDGKAVVEVAASPLFGYTNKLSASAWIYPTAYPSSDLSSILSNDQNYEFHLDTSGKLYWWWGASSFTSAAAIPLNQWTHIAITFDSSATGGRQRIYINGVADASTNNWKGTLSANPCKFYIGGDVATGSCDVISGRNFRGSIDEVKLYNYELSVAEVQADMTLGRNCSGGYDHIRIEHDASGSVCTPESVTVKACLNASCSTIYPGNVTVNMSPTGWVGGNTIVLTNGIGTASLSKSTAGNVTLGTASASPAAANVTRCFAGGAETCTMNFVNASCLFDAIEPSANPKTRLLTKMAGAAFNVDVVALTGSAVNTSYTGTVAADLVDASASSCPAGAGLTSAQNLTFVAGNAGRKPATFTYAGVAKDVRVRMVVGSGTPACSTDNFAIRPSSVNLVTSTMAVGPSETATPTIKAGTGFDLNATATSGYAGSVVLDTSKLTAQTTAQAVTVASGGVVGSLTPTTLVVNASPAASGNASYSEVGYLYLGAGAFRDEIFTAVDQPAGCAATATCDCVTDTTNDNNLSTSIVGATKRYGCHIGSTAVNLGRFVPDHFVITPVSVAPACASSAGNEFTYFGQDGFTTAFTLAAQNSANDTTKNYVGSFAKLGLTAWSGFTFTASGLPAGSSFSASSTAPTGIWSAGLASITAKHLVTRPAAPVGVGAVTVSGQPIDSDGVTLASATAVQAASTSLRYGRLRLSNVFGSEKTALSVPVQAQYWSGKSWVLNSADGCTTLPANAFALSGTIAANTSASGVALVNGVGTLTLAKPTPLATGSIDVAANLGIAGNDQSCLSSHAGTPANLVWLRSQNGSCATTYDRDPSARATFGIYAPETRRTVHVRETF